MSLAVHLLSIYQQIVNTSCGVWDWGIYDQFITLAIDLKVCEKET